MGNTTNVGTLNIRIQVQGADEAEKQISGLNAISFHKLLSGFNEIRWAMMTVQTVSNMLTGPIKTFADVAAKSLKGIATLIDISIIKPMAFVGDALLAGAKAFAVFSAAAAASMIAVGATSVKTFADVQEGIKNTMAVFGNPTDEMEQKLTDAVKRISERWGIMPQIVGAGFNAAAQAGLNLAQTISITTDAAEFAKAADMELNEAVMFLIGTMSQFGKTNTDGTLKLDELRGVMDVVTKAALASVMSIQDVAGAMKNVGPMADALGISFNQTAAGLMVLGKAGLRGPEAGTVLKTVIGRLAQNSGDAKQALDALGLTTADVNFKQHSLGEVLALVASKIEGVSDSARQNEVIMELMGLRGAKGLKLIATEGISDFKLFEKQLDSSSGTLEDFVGEKMKSFAAQTAVLTSTFENIKFDIGSNLAEGLQKGIDALMKPAAEGKASIMDMFDDVLGIMSARWGSWIGDVLPKLINWMSAEFFRIGPMLMDVFDGVMSIIEDIASGIATVWDDVVSWTENNWEELKTGTQSAWDGIKSVISSIWTSIKNVLFGEGLGSGEGLFGKLLTWWNTNGPKIIQQVTGIFDKIGLIIGPIVDSWSAWFGGFADASGGFLEQINNSLSVFIGWLNTAGASGQTGLQSLTNFFKSMGETLGTVFSKGVEIFNKFFDTTNKADPANTLFEKLANTFQTLTNYVVNIDVNKVIAGFLGIANALTTIAASSIPTFFNNLLNIISSPGFTDAIMGWYGILTAIAWVMMNILSLIGQFSAFGAAAASAFLVLVGVLFNIGNIINGFVAGTLNWGSLLGIVGAAFGWIGSVLTIILGLVQAITGFFSGDLGSAVLGILKVLGGILMVIGLIIGITAGGWIPLLIGGVIAALASVAGYFDNIKLWISEVTKAFMDAWLQAGKAVHDFLVAIFGEVGEIISNIIMVLLGPLGLSINPTVNQAGQEYSSKAGANIDMQKSKIREQEAIKAQKDAAKVQEDSAAAQENSAAAQLRAANAMTGMGGFGQGMTTQTFSQAAPVTYNTITNQVIKELSTTAATATTTEDKNTYTTPTGMTLSDDVVKALKDAGVIGGTSAQPSMLTESQYNKLSPEEKKMTNEEQIKIVDAMDNVALSTDGVGTNVTNLGTTLTTTTLFTQDEKAALELAAIKNAVGLIAYPKNTETPTTGTVMPTFDTETPTGEGFDWTGFFRAMVDSGSGQTFEDTTGTFGGTGGMMSAAGPQAPAPYLNWETFAAAKGYGIGNIPEGFQSTTTEAETPSLTNSPPFDFNTQPLVLDAGTTQSQLDISNSAKSTTEIAGYNKAIAAGMSTSSAQEEEILILGELKSLLEDIKTNTAGGGGGGGIPPPPKDPDAQG